MQQLAPEFRRGETIVAVSADLGEKYLDTVYDPTWVAKVIAADGDKSARAQKRKNRSETKNDISQFDL